MPDLHRDGFAIVPRLIEEDEVQFWRERFEGPVRAGRRNLLDDADVRRLSEDPRLRAHVGEARVVRAILFDKTPEANWAVPLHQDLNVALAERHDVLGFEPWSVKAGVHHVVPPQEILQGMIAVRLHLDPCGPDDGPLRVVPGSHLARIPEGRLPRGPFFECHVEAGDAVLMRPLAVHASPRAARPTRRRVIHFEYATVDVPPPLRWAFA